MSIRLFRTLVAVADAKTFSAAAQAVHVTHAAVSQQMQTLEAELGVTLFDRRTRTPELTPLAQQIVAKARKLVDDYDKLVPSILEDGGMTDKIALGAVPTTLTGLAPQALSGLKRLYPQMRLHIRPGLTRSLLVDLQRGTLDVALLSKPHVMPAGLVFREVVEEPMQLIAATEEPVDDPTELLKNRPFIRFNRNAVVGALIENWLLSQRIRVDETMELDSLEAIASMVQANLGVSIVPALAVSPVHGIPLKRLNLGEDAPKRSIGLACLEGQIKMNAINALHNAMCSVANPASEDTL